MTERNTSHPATCRTQGRVNVSSGLAGIRKLARENKTLRFTALLHHVTVNQLGDSYFCLKRNATPGVDEMTWQYYGGNLINNLTALHERVHTGRYRPLPSKRCYIPKADGKQRALGIASLEDKIVQHALVKVLNAIYEPDFLGFSYGFRPSRSAHNALDAVAVGMVVKKINWVLDADIQGFYDNIDHEWMLKFLQHRIADRRVLRLIVKWLRAGFSDAGKWNETAKGCPQGGICKALHTPPYAKQNTMRSKTK